MKSKLVKERRVALSAIRKGATLIVAAEKAGVSEGLVCRWTQEAGLLPGQKQKFFKALKLLVEGKLNVTEIASAAGLSRMTVHSIKNRMQATSAQP
jgi:AraC-like DNA-binding protein